MKSTYKPRVRVAFNTGIRVHKQAKGKGGFRRREKFQKNLLHTS